jgi:integrase
MGVTVRQKVRGRGQPYWVFVALGGKRTSRKIGDKKTADKVAQKIIEQIKLKSFNIEEQKKVPTFGYYAKIWIDVVVPADCKASTASDYKGILNNHIYPVFKSVPVTEITQLEVKRFLLKKINENKANSTVTHMKNVLGGVLGLAVNDSVISINPAHNLGKKFLSKKNSKEVDALSPSELQIFLDSFKKHFPRYYPLVLTMARTGMRIGEAMALQWNDIGFEKRSIKIQRGFSRGKLQTPKNNKFRTVDMSLQLAQTLKELQRSIKMEKLKYGWESLPVFVFVTEKGRPILNTSHWRRKYFDKAVEKAKLRKIHPHMLRHTYASLLIKNKESLAYIQDQLGHHSINVTVDIYGHIERDMKDEVKSLAVDYLDNVMEG